MFVIALAKATVALAARPFDAPDLLVFRYGARQLVIVVFLSLLLEQELWLGWRALREVTVVVQMMLVFVLVPVVFRGMVLPVCLVGAVRPVAVEVLLLVGGGRGGVVV